MNTYPGGKNGSGVYQTIINQMPPHQVYIEAFLGSGAILRNKLPARLANIGIDIDAEALEKFPPTKIPGLKLIHANSLEWLTQSVHVSNQNTLIHLDPPYLQYTRSSHRQIYRYETTTEDHETLLAIIKSVSCMVILSGYYSSLYAHELAGWRTVQFQALCRSGKTATEYLWMNYPEPVELHDYRYLGANFRQRECITRKKRRWINRLQKLSSLERYALLDAIQQYKINHVDTTTKSVGVIATAADTTIISDATYLPHDHTVTFSDAPAVSGPHRQKERWAPVSVAINSAPAASPLSQLPPGKEIENP
ncbi:MAG: hypothetical protein A2Z04_00175 [Chloroflexi bacterium RBG_16_57_9]|nr:MAG: hypothetical protein A2Z04_00175 [Chloroflexi bacterium RBG_16_57_9]